MRETTPHSVSRRRFIGGTFALAGALPFTPIAFAARASAANTLTAAVAVSGYRSLGTAEAAFVEAMVNALCPDDALTPNGVNSGLATFIDAHLSGDVDVEVHGQRELFRSGMAAVDAASRDRFGLSFHELAPTDARRFLREIAAGEVDAEFPVACWYSDVVEPLLKQACFSGAVYERQGGRMFWKLFG
jgi:gluconate 2-dehydrogenase gamma chain